MHGCISRWLINAKSFILYSFLYYTMYYFFTLLSAVFWKWFLSLEVFFSGIKDWLGIRLCCIFCYTKVSKAKDRKKAFVVDESLTDVPWSRLHWASLKVIKCICSLHNHWWWPVDASTQCCMLSSQMSLVPFCQLRRDRKEAWWAWGLGGTNYHVCLEDTSSHCAIRDL